MQIEDLDALCMKIQEAREVVKDLGEQKKSAQSHVDRLEYELLEFLKETNRKNYSGPNGLFYINHRMSVKVPKEEEKRKEFFWYLREKGIYDNMITVNSATLNAFYKDEIDAARERGDVDFAMPGIGEPTVSEVIAFKKGK